MKYSEQNRIKTKIVSVNPDRWWGDDYDVRFYLISRVKNLENKSILDVGGSIGIVCSEISKNNFRINLDFSFEDLKKCKDKVDSSINTVCGSMTNLPFKNNFFDYVICSNLLEVAKKADVMKNKPLKNLTCPTVDKTIGEIFRILEKRGTLLLTTPNNAYYNTTKLTFDELNRTLNLFFSNVKIFFFNTYPKFHEKNRKLNMGNVIPKIKSKITGVDNVIKNLIKEKSHKNYSVSFFVEAKRTNNE